MSTPSDNAEHGKTHQDLLETYRVVHTEDDRPGEATLDDFEDEIMNLYWSVVDSGVDENLARSWVGNLRGSLNKLLRTNQSPDLQDLGSKF